MNVKLLAEIKQVYADSRLPFQRAVKIRSLSYRSSETVTPKEAKEIFLKAGVFSYNEFRPEILDKFPADSQIQIAREGSVCLYAKGGKLPERDEVLADEMDVNFDGWVRYWWD